MALPPKRDPRRPLHLAISSMRVLTVLYFLASACVIPAAFLPKRAGAGRLLFAIFALSLYIVPGLANLIFSIYLKKRQFWAVVASLVLTCMELAFGLFAAVMFTIMLGRRGGNPITAIITWLVVIALAQLIWHLSQSFTAIKYVPIEEQRGFEVMGVQPIQPAVPTNIPEASPDTST